MAAGPFAPLPAMPQGGAPPGGPNPSGGSLASGPGAASGGPNPVEAVRGMLDMLMQATFTVQNVARQFPGVAEQAQAAVDAIQQMAAGIVTGAETGQAQPAPPSLA